MNDSFDILESLNRAFAKARLELPLRRPWVTEERQEIVSIAKASLGIEDRYIPTIDIQAIDTTVIDGIRIEKLQAETWQGCKTAAHLYLPAEVTGPLPTIMIACGHGLGGKQNPGYRKMAWQLVYTGLAVLITDNIGQGERTPMGHRDVIGPFHCGLSLQGMIVMEAMAWLDWLQSDTRFDSERIGAVGNSGGGALTLFLSALRTHQLSLVASTGYPCTFAFIAEKEKDHCHCNILPAMVGELEMWQLYGCFAPRPLFLAQGILDPLFPDDIFNQITRRVRYVYQQQGACDHFIAQVYPGEHPWDDTRMRAIRDFVATRWQLPASPLAEVPLPQDPGNCYGPSWPANALDTDSTASLITGNDSPVPQHLHTVFCPDIQSLSNVQLPRVDFHQLVAQQIAFLKPDLRPVIV